MVNCIHINFAVCCVSTDVCNSENITQIIINTVVSKTRECLLCFSGSHLFFLCLCHRNEDIFLDSFKEDERWGL